MFILSEALFGFFSHEVVVKYRRVKNDAGEQPMKTSSIIGLIDSLIDTVEKGPAADFLLKAADAPLSAFEKKMGLDDAAKRVYYGRNDPEYKSLIISYYRSLKNRIEVAADRGGGTADESDFIGAGDRKNPTGSRETAARAIRRVEELAGSAREAVNSRPVILDGDTLTPRERIEKHIRFEPVDRVAVAPLPGYNIAGTGGISVREFMTDGTAAATACRNYWDVHGGFDMLPLNFPTGYLFPLIPETHSRFCSNWILPSGNELPKMEELPILPSYEEILSDGIIGMVRTENGHLIREFRRAALQALIFAARIAVLFPRMDLFHPYAAGIVNHPADLLSMWKGFENFMIDCATDPARVREACEFLAPGLVEFGVFTAALTGSRQVLYGASRISGSWISREMFDDLFAGVFKDQIWSLHDKGYGITCHLDNDYTPMLDFFRELPEKSGFMHLDQTDMFKAKEILHGHTCLMGNVHPGVLSAGTPDDVERICERLVKEVGAGGGFILSGACEVPVDTPVENVQAMKRAVDKWGWY